MSKIRMGKISDLPPGKVLEKRIRARRVAIINDNGKIYAIEADCKHMKASLSTGHIADGVVTCRWHGWKYDLVTGNCLTNNVFSLKTYHIEIIEDEVFLIL